MAKCQKCGGKQTICWNPKSTNIFIGCTGYPQCQSAMPPNVPALAQANQYIMQLKGEVKAYNEVREMLREVLLERDEVYNPDNDSDLLDLSPGDFNMEGN